MSQARARDENTAKRQQLIDAAFRLFAERGFAGVGMREIAAEAGVSLGLIRIHFGSKDGLRQELDAIAVEEIRSLYQDMTDHDASEGLEHMVEDVVEFIKRDRVMFLYLRAAILEKTEGGQAIINAFIDILRIGHSSCILAKRPSTGVM